jgi:hypothetical protein
MTEITFSGSLDYVTYVIEKYEKEGYEVTSYKPKNNVKFGVLFSVIMKKPENLIQIERQLYAVFKAAGLAMQRQSTLSEQLAEAIEREDYETAAILRDKINKK